MPADRLVTCGISAPAGFDWESYEAVHELVRHCPARFQAKHEYNGGWNAVPLRLREAHEGDDCFRRIIREHPDRNFDAESVYRIGVALGGLFSAGLSALEACYYATYAVGTLAERREVGGFALNTPQARRAVGLNNERSRPSFPAVTFHDACLRLLNDPRYRSFSRFRNLLVHRQQPLLTISLHFGGEPHPAQVGWLGNDADEDLPYEERSTQERRDWLTEEVNKLVRASLGFVRSVQHRLPLAE